MCGDRGEGVHDGLFWMIRDRKDRTLTPGPEVRIGSMDGRGLASEATVVIVDMTKKKEFHEDIGQAISRQTIMRHKPGV